MKTVYKASVALLLAALVLGVSSPLAADDRTKAEVLNVYLLGPEPADMATITAEVNKLTQRDLNATVKWTFLGWDKWDQKYNLALSSGEPISLIYTANWANYLQIAKKGAFLPLNDLLPKAAPVIWSKVTKDQWNDAKVGGKIYTVPNDWKEFQTNNLTYRVDVAEKLGFAKPLASLDDVEKFMAAVKKSDPTFIPFNGVSDDIGGVQEAFFAKFKYDQIARSIFYLVLDQGGKMVSWYESPGYVEYAKTMKRWRDSGYIARDTMTAKILSEENFKQGKSYVATQNPTKADTMFRALSGTQPDWKIGLVVYAQLAGFVHPNAWIGNGMAVPKSSPNPERALAFVEKLRYDPAYYRLTNYGVLGKHYNLDGNFAVSIPDSGFGYQAMQPWGWHVDAQELPTKGGWPGYGPVNAALDKIAVPNKLSTFAFDEAPVQAQLAALGQVMNQYFGPINAGAVADVDKAVADAVAKLKASGFDKIKAEMQKQMDAYLAERAKN